jgi:hypothetical protein
VWKVEGVGCFGRNGGRRVVVGWLRGEGVRVRRKDMRIRL